MTVGCGRRAQPSSVHMHKEFVSSALNIVVDLGEGTEKVAGTEMVKTKIGQARGRANSPVELGLKRKVFRP